MLLHVGSVLFYMHDPTGEHYASEWWCTYYFASERFFLAAFILLFIFIEKKTWLDVQFLIIEATYNIWLGLAYILNYNKVLERTYNTKLMLTGVVITTLMILISGYRHGLFKSIKDHAGTTRNQ